MLMVRLEVSVVSTLGLGSVLELHSLTIEGQGSRSSFMGDEVSAGRATSDPGEGRG